jgi:flagellar biosynthesis protein FlhF
MKVKRYFAKDMRQALRLVRDEQGPDAVILSTEKVTGGVEIVAAIDYDAEVVHGRAEAAVVEESPRFAEELVAARPETRPAVLPEISPDQANMSEELRTLRRMLETQIATLAWNDLTRRAPVHTQLLKELTSFGLSNDLAAELITQLPARLEFAEAHRLALGLLSRRIQIAEERWLDHGGVVAFVGPTGVGKTTLVAKLAARWVLRHGPSSLALVSADAIRIGAQDQIHTLGRLLGVPSYAVEGPRELTATLRALGDRRLVLIDTAGLSQRDARLAAELADLTGASGRVETCLVLSASAQAGSLEESVSRFAAARPASCVITKLDEATSLGGIISTLIRSALPLAYVSEGQRVPEDLNPARAHQVIARAVDLARKSGATPDEDLLQRRFGAVAHALA